MYINTVTDGYKHDRVYSMIVRLKSINDDYGTGFPD